MWEKCAQSHSFGLGRVGAGIPLGGGGVAEQNRVYLEAQRCELHECYAHPHTELEQAYRVQTRQRAVLVRLGKRSHRHLL